MPVTVKLRTDFSVCGLQGDLLWYCRDSAFSQPVGWKLGCQPFSCPCSLNVMHCQKESYAACLSKESMPFVKSKPPLPSRSLRSLRAAARSTSSLCLRNACKRYQKIELWYPRCALSNIDCDLGCFLYASAARQ